MSVTKLRQALTRLQEALIKRSYYADKDKKGIRLQTYGSQIVSNVKMVEEYLWQVVPNVPNNDARLELLVLLNNMKLTRDTRAMLMMCSRMDALLTDMKDQRGISFTVSRLPEDVRNELLADLDELKRCYQAQCGRLLEIGLHRKYYEETGHDVLEKSPGIGLGNLVKKLVEKEVEMDPGLTQQIHLINNVRVFSVHKKQQVFKPSKAQTHAIILFTLDTLEKLFQ
jgi:hypothetical protein